MKAPNSFLSSRRRAEFDGSVEILPRRGGQAEGEPGRLHSLAHVAGDSRETSQCFECLRVREAGQRLLLVGECDDTFFLLVEGAARGFHRELEAAKGFLLAQCRLGRGLKEGRDPGDRGEARELVE
jgi:hypothetical protein